VSSSFLALGDSYTIGEGVAEADRWPMQLAARLRAAGVDIAEPRIIAKTGWTADELLAAIRNDQVRGTFGLVTLLVGVNDQFRGFGVARYTESFERLLRLALGFAKLPSDLIVLSIPDWSVTPFVAGRPQSAIANEIDAFNGVNRTAATDAGARYLDVTAASRRATDNATLIAADGLHPSATMYSMWVDLLVPLALGVLNTPRQPGGGR
jgi:lysophospholipase L1-like esterase